MPLLLLLLLRSTLGSDAGLLGAELVAPEGSAIAPTQEQLAFWYSDSRGSLYPHRLEDFAGRVFRATTVQGTPSNVVGDLPSIESQVGTHQDYTILRQLNGGTENAGVWDVVGHDNKPYILKFLKTDADAFEAAAELNFLRDATAQLVGEVQRGELAADAHTYIPRLAADHIEYQGQRLPVILMEKARGRELFAFEISDGMVAGAKFVALEDDAQAEALKRAVADMMTFMAAHGWTVYDWNCGNVMYDPETETLTRIDLGNAVVYNTNNADEVEAMFRNWKDPTNPKRHYDCAQIPDLPENWRDDHVSAFAELLDWQINKSNYPVGNMFGECGQRITLGQMVKKVHREGWIPRCITRMLCCMDIKGEEHYKNHYRRVLPAPVLDSILEGRPVWVMKNYLAYPWGQGYPARAE